MITRKEKNKDKVNKIQREKAQHISKNILKTISIVILLGFLLFSYIYFIGVKGLITHEEIIYDSQIPKSFYGVKILHLTDLLYGMEIDNNYLTRLEEEIQLINPDIVFFTGNIINPKYAVNQDEIEKLNQFFTNIPYSLGKYAIKGNFDNASFDLIMENTNFTILNTEIITIYNNSLEAIDIVNLSNHQPNVLHYSIGLIHNYNNYSNDFYPNLIFGGNNLGGEIKIFNLSLVNSPYNSHFYNENNSQIYLSSGLGSLHHMRFMNHPSINVYRLSNKEQ